MIQTNLPILVFATKSNDLKWCFNNAVSYYIYYNIHNFDKPIDLKPYTSP